MGKWEEKKIGDCIVEIQTGKTPPKSNKLYYENTSVDWFSPSDFNDDIKELSNSKNKISELAISENKAKIYPLNSLLLVGIGATIGKVGLLKYTASSNQQITALTFKNHINADFAYYWFRNLKEYIVNMSSSATMPIINQKEIKKIPFRYPKSLPEQQRIVAKLDGLFAKIDQAIGLLEENIAHTKALMGSVLDGIFDKVYKEHKAVPLLKYVDFIGGSQPPKSSFSYELNEGYVRLIQIRDYKSDRHLVYIKEDSTKKFCEEDDVMIGRYGPPVFQILRGLKGAYNVALMKAIPDEEVIIKDYLYYFLMNGKIQSYINSISQRSAGQFGVNKKALEAYEIAIPPLVRQQQIVDTIKAAIPKIDKAQELTNQNLENLKALKNSLLEQAFKGEL